MLVAGRVRDAIACCECNKLRCIYAQSTLNVQQMLMINKAKEEGYYCGLSLFPEGHPLHSTVRVRMALNCTSNIEATYYGAPRCFDTIICVFCGSAESIADNDDILELMQKFHTVRPVCVSCYESGETTNKRTKECKGNQEAKTFLTCLYVNFSNIMCVYVFLPIKMTS